MKILKIQKMKKILVTGGCGFIGSNFVRHIINKHTFIPVVLDNLTLCSGLSNLRDLNSKNYIFVKGDICDEELVFKLF